MRLLYVEDDPRLARNVKRGLEEEGFAVDISVDGEDGLFMAMNCSYDVVILDRMLPKMEGLEVLAAMRKQGNETPVLVLTALGEIRDRVSGLDTGADDYLGKPFAFDELLSRLRALIRRSTGHSSNILQLGDIQLDLNRHEVSYKDQALVFTATEFSLLEYLFLHPDEVVSRIKLTEHLFDDDFDRDSNLIEVHIHNLRKKLKDCGCKPLIHTVRGVGYVASDKR